MKTNATPQNFQAYFFGAAQRRFSLLPPIRYAGFLMGKRHRVTRMFTTCSFSFILSGRGTYLHRGRTLRVVAPCLLLEWPGEAMDYGPDDSWDETFISYPADLIGTFCRSGFMDLDEPVRPIPDPESVLAQSERLHRFLQQSAPDPDSTDACCYALLLASRTSASVNAAKAPPRITRLEQQLAESRETWEQIAAEKEALQDDLRAKQKELKEAKLTLDETTERASELKAENEQLRKDINLLKEKQNQDSK